MKFTEKKVSNLGGDEGFVGFKKRKMAGTRNIRKDADDEF